MSNISLFSCFKECFKYFGWASDQEDSLTAKRKVKKENAKTQHVAQGTLQKIIPSKDTMENSKTNLNEKPFLKNERISTSTVNTGSPSTVPNKRSLYDSLLPFDDQFLFEDPHSLQATIEVFHKNGILDDIMKKHGKKND